MADPVVIVGGGAAGLATARELMLRRVPCRVLERGAAAGQTWADLYDSLRLHTGRHLSALAGMRMPRGTPLFPTRLDYHHYLRTYAHAYDLPVETGRTVDAVRRSDGGWLVESGGERIAARAVVMATGIVANPLIPRFAGRDDFERAGGRVLHSSAYRRPDPFIGRRVLVVGVGNSGGEIGSELARSGVAVTVAVRSGAHVVPLTLGGIPIQYVATVVRRLPRGAQERVVALVRRASERRRGPPVLPVPQRSPLDAIPLIGFSLVDEVRAGRVLVRAGVDAFVTGGVRFTDGVEEAFDDVILATGFQPALDVLGNAVRRDARGFALRSDRVTSADHADLFFVGHNYDSRGGLLNIRADAPLAAARAARVHNHRSTFAGELIMPVRQPFSELQPVRRTLMQRLLGRMPRENAAVGVNNLLARAAGVRSVSREEVEGICARHRTTLHGPLAGRFERLYRDYLTYCLEDRHLSGAELADLAHLQHVLRIAPETVAAIHEYVARAVYSRSVAQVLDDGVIDAAERDFLGRLQQELALSGRAAHRILESKLRQRAE
ncbi:MAG TPA: NAD(P)-binding domain-containing protein [Longimicrobiales bacterium]